MDLSTLDTVAASEQGARMEVQHPTTNEVLTQRSGEPVTITLAGQDSKRFRDAERKASNKRLATQASGRMIRMTSEGIDNDRLEALVSCTITWEGVGWDGADKEFTPANAREAYKKLPWLREQAEAFTADRANFLKAPPTN